MVAVCLFAVSRNTIRFLFGSRLDLTGQRTFPSMTFLHSRVHLLLATLYHLSTEPVQVLTDFLLSSTASWVGIRKPAAGQHYQTNGPCPLSSFVSIFHELVTGLQSVHKDPTRGRHNRPTLRQGSRETPISSLLVGVPTPQSESPKTPSRPVRPSPLMDAWKKRGLFSSSNLMTRSEKLDTSTGNPMGWHVYSEVVGSNSCSGGGVNQSSGCGVIVFRSQQPEG